MSGSVVEAFKAELKGLRNIQGHHPFPCGQAPANGSRKKAGEGAARREGTQEATLIGSTENSVYRHARPPNTIFLLLNTPPT